MNEILYLPRKFIFMIEVPFINCTFTLEVKNVNKQNQAKFGSVQTSDLINETNILNSCALKSIIYYSFV